MKNLFILLLVCTKIFAQTSTNTKLLDKNKVKAKINTSNDKFWDIYGTGNQAYEVPAGSGRHANFANSIWIGGLDAGGQLHMAANTYKQSGTDFWPGPLDTTSIGTFNSANTAPYNRLWKVDCSDINNFIYSFNSGAVAANTYTIPNDILNYPARGTANFQKSMHPFHDANGDGMYDPQGAGDYPLIKGHQQILSIYNDNYGTHTESQSAKMGIEIHEHSFAYYEPSAHDSMQAINYTTFYQYTIYNRSSFSYNNVYVTDWADVDVGYYLNDYIGTDTINNFAYCYNAGSFDTSALGVLGYGKHPPVSSYALLPIDCSNDNVDNNNNGVIDEAGEMFGLDKTTYYNNNYNTFPPQTTNPSNASHYYGYMRGFWKDGSPYTYGGTGLGGTSLTDYVYPGDPQNNIGWTEMQAGNTAGDRRILLSSGPFTFPANSKIEWGYAVVFSQDTTMPINTIMEFRTRVQRDVKNTRYYHMQHQNPQCTPVVVPPSTVGLDKNSLPKLNAYIYPNPSNGLLNVDLSQNVTQGIVSVFDLVGKKVLETQINNAYRTQIDLSGLQNGVYLLEVKSDKGYLMEKVIKD